PSHASARPWVGTREIWPAAPFHGATGRGGEGSRRDALRWIFPHSRLRLEPYICGAPGQHGVGRLAPHAAFGDRPLQALLDVLYGSEFLLRSATRLDQADRVGRHLRLDRAGRTIWLAHSVRARRAAGSERSETELCRRPSNRALPSRAGLHLVEESISRSEPDRLRRPRLVVSQRQLLRQTGQHRPDLVPLCRAC